MNKAINTNAKDRFARLLATENIDVIHDSKAETASFNTASRVLRLPRWKEMSGQLYDMLVAHEVGHALYTPANFDPINEMADRHGVDPMVVKDYVNVVEDARIERLMKQKFPGLRRDFIAAYNDLMNREFFGDLSKINDMAFIDRINLHYKAGTIGMDVRFDEDENRMINTIDESETWEDVLDIVDTLLVDAAKKVKEQEQEQGNQGLKGDPGDEEVDSDTGETGETDETESSDKTEGSNDTVEKSEETSDIKGESSSSAVPRSETQKNFEDSMQEFRRQPARWEQDSEDCIMPVPTFNPEDCMSDWTELYSGDKGIDAHYTNEMLTADTLDEVTRFMDESRKICRGMAQEFLRKQKAVAFRRATIAKTGVLDMQKMVNYKWSEDIFRKSTILPNGKNHGLVILVDWSSSMECVMKDTIRQAIQMAMFCRMVNIPFEVYSFSSVADEYSENWRNNKTTQYKDDKGEKIFDSNLRMRNYLSSRMPKQRFFEACHRMGIMSTCWDWHRNHKGPRYADCLGSTPLDDAIWTMTQWLPKYRESNGIEIMNTLFISDGATTSRLGHGHRAQVIKDGHHYFGREASIDWSVSSTEIALDVLRHRSGSRLIQFFLADNKSISDKYGRSRIHQLNGTPAEMSACHEQYKKEKWCVAPNKIGFDERFIMHGKNSVQNTDGFSDMGRSDEDGVTITKIRNSFVKSMKQTTTSRAMLNRFIDIIA